MPIALGDVRAAGVRAQLSFVPGGVFAIGNNLEWWPGSDEPLRHAFVVRASL